MFKISELIKNRRSIAKRINERYRIKKVGRLQYPIAQEIEYSRFLKSLVQFINKQIDEKLISNLPRLIRSSDFVRGRMDSYTDDINEIINAIKATVGEQFTEEQVRHAVRARGLHLAEWNRKQMTRILSAAISVDVFFNEPYLKPELDGFINTNVNLIESIKQEHLKNVEQTVSRGIRSGMRVGDLEKSIKEKYKVSESKAELIARDQIGKFNGDLNHLRQQELGIKKYIWRTVKDERVRDAHAELDGTVQSWDDPPIVSSDGRAEHPGGDFQCRCQAEPILDF